MKPLGYYLAVAWTLLWGTCRAGREVLRHLLRFVHQPGPPQIEAPKVRSIRGKVTKRYERPAYSLVEEE